MSDSIDDYPIIFDAPATWSISVGVQPHRGNFLVSTAAAKKLYEKSKGQPKPVVLKLGHMTFEKLFVTGLGATHHPDVMSIEIQDLRWLWQSVTVQFSANLTRRSGRARWVSGNVAQFTQQTLDLDFWLWSLRGGTTPWRIDEVATAVMGQIQAKTASYVNWNVPSFPGSTVATPQDLRLDGPAPQALTRLIQDLGGWELYVSPAGEVHWVDTRSMADVAIAIAATKASDTQMPTISDQRFRRPKEIHYLLDPEMEVRLDNYQGGSVTAGSPAEAPRHIVNVLPVPLPTLTVGGVERAAGEHISFDDLPEAVSTLTKRSLAPTLTLDVVRQRYTGQRLMYTYAAPLLGDPPNEDWAIVVSAIYAHFLTTWQIVRQWRDRIRSWRPYRVGVINPETGDRASSQAYANVAVYWGIPPGWRNLSDLRECIQNISGWSADLSTAKPVDSAISIVDEDQMIFSVRYMTQSGGMKLTYPCHIREATIPSSGPPSVIGAITAMNQHGSMLLSDDPKIAVVISAVPARPVLKRIIVTPADAEARLGSPIGPCEGPVLEVRIQASNQTAMYAWRDDMSDSIERAFGQGIPDQDSVPADMEPALDALWVNKDILTEYCRARAAETYSTMQDQAIGSATVPFLDADARPRGSLRVINFTVDSQGENMLLVFSEMRSGASIQDLLDDSTRKAIFRLVQRD